MQRLKGIDAGFFYAESNRAPMHIGQLLIYDQSTTTNGVVRFKDILNTYRRCLKSSPLFTKRVVNVPMNLDDPYWIDDDNFDLEYHVRHIALPQPGDWRQLCIQIARLQSRALDMSRPLWETYVIEGLDNVEGLPKNCFALFTKVHHACIDGTSGIQLLNDMHDIKPTKHEAEPVIVSSTPENDQPGVVKMLWDAYWNNLSAPLKLAEVLNDSVPAIQKTLEAKKQIKLKADEKKARSRFNAAITSNRVFGGVTYDLNNIKNMVEGATVNDVILTIVGGALHAYLKQHDELPEVSLVAGAPVNIRQKGDKSNAGNMISMMSISLFSDIEDDFERLKAIHQETVASKAYQNAVGASSLVDMASNVPSLITSLGLRAATETGIMAEAEPMYNTTVTNVPGVQLPLYMEEAQLVRSYGTGPCVDGMGLIHPVASYNGIVCLSFVSCRDMLPDPSFYEECLLQTYENLKAISEK